MKQYRLLGMICGLMLLVVVGAQPGFACHRGQTTNYNFVIVDRDSNRQMVCHHVDVNDNSSEMICNWISTNDQSQSVMRSSPSVQPLAMAAEDDFIAPKLLMAALIIGIHFLFGLVHTWLRGKKKDKV